MDKPISGGCLCCTQAFRIAKTDRLKKKASKHQQKIHGRCYFRIRNKYLMQPINKERFKKIKKVKDQYILSPEIMERIFSHLAVDNLKICRLVSQCWNREACRVLRKKGNTTILDAKGCWSFYQLVNSGRIMQLPSPFSQLSICIPGDDIVEITTLYFSFLKKYDFLKIKKLTFEEIDCYTDQDYIAEAEKALTLLAHCAPTLSHLRIMYWKLPPKSRETCSKLEFPQLEALFVNGVGAIHYIDYEDFPNEVVWLKKMMSACPSLSRLYLQAGDENELIECGVLKNIRKLTYLPNKLRKAVNVLKDPRTELDNLNALDIICTSVNERARHANVMQALARHSHSLKRLRWEAGKCPLEGELPHCPNLTQLELNELKLPQLNLTPLTSLKSITFEKASFENVQSVNNEAATIRVCPSVEEITILGRAVPLRDWRGRRWGWRGGDDDDPNLVEMFSNLFRYFPNAVKWSMETRFVDSFRQVVLANKIKVKKLEWYIYSDEASPVPDLSAFPDLEVLGLDMEKFDGIPESVIRDQILKLPNLKCLQLANVSCVKDLLKFSKELAHLKIIFPNLNSHENSRMIEAIFTHFPLAENKQVFDLNSKSEFPGSFELCYMDCGDWRSPSLTPEPEEPMD